MSAVTTPTVERVEVDPRTLLIDVNIRLDARLDKDFTNSIKDLGVLVPITAVRTAGGDLRVRFGHRRTLAAIEGGLDTVPVEVIGGEGSDDAAQVLRIVTQHAENAHRAGLTTAEELNVVEQLTAFGMSANQIQRKTRIKKASVEAALTVSSSEVAKQATERHDFLSLDQAAAVAEFEDDQEAVKDLVSAAGDGSFEHTLQRLRDTKEEREAKAVAVAPLVESGVTIIERPAWNDPAKRLSGLVHEGEQLDETNHAKCPGHAAFLEEAWEEVEDEQADAQSHEEADYDDEDGSYVLTWQPTYVCTDPKEHGHSSRSEQYGRGVKTDRTPEQVEADRAERRRVLANNKAWRSAETVRREWLAGFLAKKSAPKDAARFVFLAIAHGDADLTKAMQEGHRYGAPLAGVEMEIAGYVPSRRPLIEATETASDARAQVMALALVLGAHEEQTGVHSWRHENRAVRRYFAALESWGYVLSDVERLVFGKVETQDEEKTEAQ